MIGQRWRGELQVLISMGSGPMLKMLWTGIGSRMTMLSQRHYKMRRRLASGVHGLRKDRRQSELRIRLSEWLKVYYTNQKESAISEGYAASVPSCKREQG